MEVSVYTKEYFPDDIKPLYAEIYLEYPNAEMEEDDNLLIIRVGKKEASDINTLENNIRRIIEEYGN